MAKLRRYRAADRRALILLRAQRPAVQVRQVGIVGIDEQYRDVAAVNDRRDPRQDRVEYPFGLPGGKDEPVDVAQRSHRFELPAQLLRHGVHGVAELVEFTVALQVESRLEVAS